MRNQLQPYFEAFYRHSGIRIMVAAIKRFMLLGHKTHAAALTYTTLFALVPLITVMYSVLSMIPSLQQGRGAIEEILLGNLVPSSAETLMGYLYQFSEQARQLTTIGIVLLMVTAFMMLRSIEDSFNKIWLLKKGRKGVSSFLLYWAVLSLGPLLLSAGLGVSSYIASLGLWQEDWVPSSWVLLLAIVVPYLTSFLAFTFIYWAVPNIKVPLKHAAIGGAVVALLFQIGQEVFAEASTFFPSYQLIYGAFAAVPLFLLWLFLSWSVILLGSEVVFLLGNNDWADDEHKVKQAKQQKAKNRAAAKDAAKDTDKAAATNHFTGADEGVIDSVNLSQYKSSVALQVLNIMSQQQINGNGVSLAELLSLVENSPLRAESLNQQALRCVLEEVLTTLQAAKLLLYQVSADDCNEDGDYFLIRDLHHYPLNDFLNDVFYKAV